MFKFVCPDFPQKNNGHPSDIKLKYNFQNSFFTFRLLRFFIKIFKDVRLLLSFRFVRFFPAPGQFVAIQFELLPDHH